MPLRTLLSGFGPFGNVLDNPTERLCAHFSTHSIPGHEITVCPLPTSYSRAATTLVAKIQANVQEQRPYDLVLMLGVAAGFNAWRVETQGLNWDAPAIPDIDGYSKSEGEIIPGGPARLPVTLPVDPIERAISALGAPVVLSRSAGSYLCNHLLYQVLHHLRASETRAGFLHVPADERTFGSTVPADHDIIFPFSQHIDVVTAALTACGTLTDPR